jgi:putative Mg2+ transporter-C (MgtC) family protein
MNDFGIDSDALVRIAAALVLGAAVGIEREVSEQAAGLRTHIAVAMGAAVFGVVSTLGFLEFEGSQRSTNIQFDVTRVASQVVVGIGFLGAGLIFRRRTEVYNLTTAASLWVVAAIGLTCGVGDIGTAGVATALLLGALVLLRPLRRWLKQAFVATQRCALRIRLAEGASPEEFMAGLIPGEGISVGRQAHEKEGGRQALVLEAAGKEDRLVRFQADLAARPDVEELKVI